MKLKQRNRCLNFTEQQRNACETHAKPSERETVEKQQSEKIAHSGTAPKYRKTSEDIAGLALEQMGEIMLERDIIVCFIR